MRCRDPLADALRFEQPLAALRVERMSTAWWPNEPIGGCARSNSSERAGRVLACGCEVASVSAVDRSLHVLDMRQVADVVATKSIRKIDRGRMCTRVHENHVGFPPRRNRATVAVMDSTRAAC